jgi:hypothetical protein
MTNSKDKKKKVKIKKRENVIYLITHLIIFSFARTFVQLITKAKDYRATFKGNKN